MKPIRLVLVDDHAILRQGLRSVLERDDDLIVVGEAPSEVEAETIVRATNPDVVLLDLKLSAGSEFEGLHPVRQAVQRLSRPGTAGPHDIPRRGPRGARQCTRAPADTSSRTSTPPSWCAPMRAVFPQAKAPSTRAAPRRWCGRCRDAQNERQQLTDREIEVLRLLAAGLSNNKIGEKLYISATTAKFHVHDIMRKLEVSRRAEAVYAASKRGLI